MGKQDSVLWTIERRPCGACKHFKLDFGASVLGLCSKKLMTVTAITCIQYKNETCIENKNEAFPANIRSVVLM